MNFYKKITKNLLENHPILWHSKFLQLISIGIIIWIISYLTGYFFTTIDTLNQFSINEFYFELFYFAFHIILSIIIFSLWAISFYKNNAIRKFYPLKNGYLFKIFLLLFISFALIISAYIPFTLGSYHKTKKIVNHTILQNNIRQLNTAYPFIADESSNYTFEERSYPEIFIDLSHDIINGNRDDDNVFLFPNNERPTIIRYIGNYGRFHASRKYPYTNIDGSDYVFYKTIEIPNVDSCKYYSFSDSIYNLSSINNIYYSSIYNFSSLISSLNGNLRTDVEYAQDYAPQIHQWAKENNKDAIIKAVKSFQTICNEYHIKNYINADSIYEYWNYNKYMYPSIIVDKSVHRDEYNNSYDNEYAEAVEATEVAVETADAAAGIIDKNETSTKQDIIDNSNYNDSNLETAPSTNIINIEKNRTPYYYDKDALKQIIENEETAQENNFQFSYFIFFVIAAFFLAWASILFEFTSLKSFLFCIPISGILMILTFIVAILIKYTTSSILNLNPDDNSMLSAVLLVASIILIFMLIGVFTNFIRKSFVEILYNLSYVIAPFIITGYLILYNELTKVLVGEKCDVAHYETPFYIDIAIFILAAFIGQFLILMLTTKLKAKEE